MGRRTEGGHAARWTAAERARYSQLMQAREAWASSTGPRSAEGKAKVSQNARKHGPLAWAEQRLTHAYLRSIAALLVVKYCGRGIQ